MSFAYDEKTKRVSWDSLTNIRPWGYETSTSLSQIIDNFNINTNLWVKNYVFKRCKGFGNKHISSMLALLFLALWHGYHLGYVLCFGLEFMYVEAERRVRDRFAASNIPSVISNAVGFVWTNLSLYYGLGGFALKTVSDSLEFYKSLYYFGHISILFIFVFDTVLPRRPKAKKID